MLKRAPIEPLREILKIDNIDLFQVERRSESFLKGVMRIECRSEEG